MKKQGFYKRINTKGYHFRTKRNCREGVTLVEILVAVGLGVLILTIGLAIQVLARQTYEFGISFLDIHGGARMALDWMTKDIRRANQVVNSKTINSQTYTTADNELVLEIPSTDSNGNVIPSTNDYVAYQLNDTDPTKLERIIDADPLSSRTDETRVVTNYVNALNFSSGGTGLSGWGDVTTLTQIRIALTETKIATSGNVVDMNLNSVIKLRNK